MFNRKTQSTKSTKGNTGIKTLAKRAVVIMFSFMMAIQVIPFLMYDMDSYAATRSTQKVWYIYDTNDNLVDPYLIFHNELKYSVGSELRSVISSEFKPVVAVSGAMGITLKVKYVEDGYFTTGSGAGEFKLYDSHDNFIKILGYKTTSSGSWSTSGSELSLEATLSKKSLYLKIDTSSLEPVPAIEEKYVTYEEIFPKYEGITYKLGTYREEPQSLSTIKNEYKTTSKVSLALGASSGTEKILNIPTSFTTLFYQYYYFSEDDNNCGGEFKPEGSTAEYGTDQAFFDVSLLGGGIKTGYPTYKNFIQTRGGNYTQLFPDTSIVSVVKEEIPHLYQDSDETDTELQGSSVISKTHAVVYDVKSTSNYSITDNNRFKSELYINGKHVYTDTESSGLGISGIVKSREIFDAFKKGNGKGTSASDPIKIQVLFRPDVTRTGNSLSHTFTAATGGTVNKTSASIAWGTPYHVSDDNKTLTIGSTTVTATPSTGYSMDGWYIGDTKITNTTDPSALEDGVNSIAGATAFTAKFKANQYTVTLDNQSATTAGTASVTATYNSAMPTITVPAKTNYDFGGYYTSTGGSGTQYIKADGTSAKKWDKTDNTTLYAKWTGKQTTVTLNPNNGKFDAKQNSNTYTATSLRFKANYDTAMPTGCSYDFLYTNGTWYGGTGHTLDEVIIPKRDGYTFAGYFNTNAASGGTQYYTATGASARKWDKTSDTTLYARWTVNTYKISYAGMDGASYGSTAPTTATYDTAFTVSNPSKTGYTFSGWKITGMDGVTHTFGDSTTNNDTIDSTTATSFKNLHSTKDATVTFTAQWEAKTYTITLDRQSGSGGDASKTATYNAAWPSVSPPSRTGYTFNGYYSSTGSSATKYYNADGTTTQTTNWTRTSGITLYAKWTANTYKITYDGMSGATHGTNHPTSATYDTSFTVDNPTKTGYTFSGWKITGMDNNQHSYGTSTTSAVSIDSTTATSFKNLHSTKDETVKFTAQWTANELNFSGKNVTITTDLTSTQLIPFDAATNGTGTYTYSVTSQSPSAGFTVDGLNIKVPKSIAGNTYTVKVTAKDSNSGSTKEVTFTITVNKLESILTSPADQTWGIVSYKKSTNQTTTLTGFTGAQGTLTYAISDVRMDSATGTSVKNKGYFTINNSKVLTYIANTMPGVYVITVKGTDTGSTVYKGGEKTFTVTVTVKDTEKPTAAMTSTNNVASQQTITLTGTDDIAIVKYYFGTSKTGTPNTNWGATNTGIANDKTTYYLITQDAAGNNSDPAEMSFYKTTLVAPLEPYPEATVTPTTVITQVTKAFNMPLLTVPTGFHEVENDAWTSTGTATKVDKGGLYTPNGNYTFTGSYEANPLEFDNVQKDYSGQEGIQYLDIKSARKGTGNYEYTITTQPSGGYFSMDNNSRIAIATKTPTGSFPIWLKVYDTKSHVSAEARYVVNMNKEVATIEFNSETLALNYPQMDTIEIKKNTSGGNVTINSKNKNIAKAEIRDNKYIDITPGTKAGTTVISVMVEATAMYSSVEKEIKVTVNNGKFTVTPISAEAEANGDMHYAQISANIDGVQIRYSKDTSYSYILNLGEANVAKELSKTGRKEEGTTTINYRATCAGYETVEGQTTVTITDNQIPTGEITDVTTKLKSSQTVTLKAQDNDRIEAVYFGKNASGSPVPLSNATANFEREKVEVAEGPGTYYFIVKDVKGNVETVATMDFYATTFAVDFGRTNLDTVLLKAGEEFSLPMITASTGYKSETVKWEISGNGTKYDQGDTYKPLATETLNASCIEKTAELSYDNNGHGATAPETQTMWYTKEATAAPAMANIDGYTFTGWNTDSEGKGTYVAASGTVKDAIVIPENTVLYAMWEKNELEFADQTFDNLTTSTVDQAVEISGASNGTGDYEYEVLVQAGDYFTADNSNDTIIISSTTPAGDYVITVQAKDKGNEKTAVATYKFTLKRMSYAISLDKNVVSMLTTSAETIPVNNPSGGDLIVEIDNQSLITAVISNGSLAITPMGIIGTTTVTVTAKETGYYESATTTCTVTVDKVRTLYGGFENVSNDRAENQSMTLHVTCEDKIIGVYFGKDSNGETVDLETPATEYTKPVTVDEAGTYYLIAADNLGRTEIIDTVTFYRTRFSVPNGDTAIYGVLTKVGSSFFLPEISANPGYLAPTLWLNEQGDMAPGAEYFPTSNTDFSATCTLKQEEELPADLSIAVTGKSLSVGSDLAVNFYFAIPEEIQGGEMTFEIEHSDQEQVIDGEDKSQGIRYCYKINVNQMSDGITWEYEKDGKTWESDTDYSFYDYLNTATDGLDSSNKKLADFANKLKTYGYYAQNYLASYDGEEHFKIGEKYEAIPVPTFDPTETDLSGYVISADGTDANIDTSNILQSLVLDNVISMKLYIPTTCTNVAELGITVDEAAVEPGDVRITESGYLEIVVPKISATKLAYVHTITVNEVTIKASAMAYANKLKQDSDTLAQKLGAALYDLYQSAVDYRK